MNNLNSLFEKLLNALDWEDWVHSTGTEHERTLAAQNIGTLRKLAREALDSYSPNWSIGQLWRDRHGYIWRVREVLGDVATLEMTGATWSRGFTQREIPEGWNLLTG